jgi:hypothetical protein
MEDILEDLKQFITTTVGQTETRLREEITGTETRLREEITGTETRLREEITGTETQLLRRMDGGFVGVGDAVDVIQEEVTRNEQRLTKLEKRIA